MGCHGNHAFLHYLNGFIIRTTFLHLRGSTKIWHACENALGVQRRSNYQLPTPQGL